jgi:hypothetical protein
VSHDFSKVIVIMKNLMVLSRFFITAAMAKKIIYHKLEQVMFLICVCYGFFFPL